MGAVAINGALIPRVGTSPLLAISAMDGDRLLSCAVIDTGEVDMSEPIVLPRCLDRILSTGRIT